MRELVPSDIITEKLARDGSLKVTEVEVEDALESTLTWFIYADTYADIYIYIYIYTGGSGQCSGATQYHKISCSCAQTFILFVSQSTIV